MSQTKHRSVRVDSKAPMDEIEQAMHIKAHRARKKSGQVEFDLNDEFSDSDYEDLLPEIEYLLGKNR